MKTTAGLLAFLLIGFILSSCSTTQETVKDETTTTIDSVYIFDEVPPDTTTTTTTTTLFPEDPLPKGKYFVVQIGAFTTREKADTFAELFLSKVSKEVKIEYSKDVYLFVVQIIPPYEKRQDAEADRDMIKLNPEFSDVWILTITK